MIFIKKNKKKNKKKEKCTTKIYLPLVPVHTQMENT